MASVCYQCTASYLDFLLSIYKILVCQHYCTYRMYSLYVRCTAAGVLTFSFFIRSWFASNAFPITMAPECPIRLLLISMDVIVPDVCRILAIPKAPSFPSPFIARLTVRRRLLVWKRFINNTTYTC